MDNYRKSTTQEQERNEQLTLMLNKVQGQQLQCTMYTMYMYMYIYMHAYTYMIVCRCEGVAGLGYGQRI